MSNSIHLRSIAFYTRRIARRSRKIAADIPATGIYIRANAADSRETGIYWSEIATYSREIAADIQEMAANIGEIGIYTRRNDARSRGMAANSPFAVISARFAENLPILRLANDTNDFNAAWIAARSVADVLKMRMPLQVPPDAEAGVQGGYSS